MRTVEGKATAASHQMEMLMTHLIEKVSIALTLYLAKNAKFALPIGLPIWHSFFLCPAIYHYDLAGPKCLGSSRWVSISQSCLSKITDR